MRYVQQGCRWEVLNPRLGWQSGTWSSVKCGHRQTLLKCDFFHLLVTQRKRCRHSELQLGEDVFLCFHFKESRGFSYHTGVSSPSLAWVMFPVLFLAASADWQECISLKHGTAMFPLHQLLKAHCSHFSTGSEIQPSQTTYCPLLLHIFLYFRHPTEHEDWIICFRQGLHLNELNQSHPSSDTRRQLGVFKVPYLVTGLFLAGKWRGAWACLSVMEYSCLGLCFMHRWDALILI